MVDQAHAIPLSKSEGERVKAGSDDEGRYGVCIPFVADLGRLQRKHGLAIDAHGHGE